jgi:hypothetical protein
MRTLKLFGFAFAAALLIAACGGDDTADQTTPDDSGSTSSVVDTTTTTAGGADLGGDDGDTTTTAPADGTSSERIDVDSSTLPTEPSGIDTLSADWCSLYDVTDLDAFFLGSGDLVQEEALGDQCSWSVDGLPDTHYVTVGNGAYDSEIAFIQSGLDGAEKEEATYNGYTVWINRGPDRTAFIEADDGLQIKLLIHGEFDGPGGFWRNSLRYMDPALDALLDNITSRL